MINKVILIGHLGRDPEVRHLENGGMVARFSVATNESRRDKSGEWQKFTEWHDITAWGVLAERVAQQLHKGNLVYIEGRITHRKWQDKEGRERYSTEIVPNVLRNLEKRENQRTTGTADSTNTEEEMHGMSTDDDMPF